MILRLVRGRAEPEQLAALCAELRARLLTVGEPNGPTRFHLGTRPDGKDAGILLASSWPSAEAAARGDSGEVSPLSIARRCELHFLEAAAFEVDETIVRHSEAQPVAIRVATGRFSRHGADIEMQELLRRRAPLIDDDMTEAYVGRRMVGRAVEVTFVSAWQRVPPQRRLEDSFWPDIALRYDHFEVEVYSALSLGEA